MKPAIHYVIDEAIEAGIEEVLIVVSRSKNMITDYFDRSIELETLIEQKKKHQLLEKIKLPDIRIQYTRQSYPLGLGDAVRIGESFVGNEPFAVLLPDEMIFGKDRAALTQLISEYNSHKKSVLGLYEVKQQYLSNYGVVESMQVESKLLIQSIVEKPKKTPPSNFAVIGRYVFTPLLFSYLAKSSESVDGEIQLTDAINEMLKKDKCYGVKIEGSRFDISRLDEYIGANQFVLKS